MLRSKLQFISTNKN